MATPQTGATATARAPLRARISWMLFDWSVQPFYTLILTFLFAPYFANVVVGDGPQGQSMWGFGAAIAGIFIALGSPFLGAFADGRGQRKPWIALFSVILAIAMASLWIATPAAPSSTIYLVLLAFIIATVCAEYTAVFTNAIMPSLVPQSELGRLSGSGWACGYFGGLASLFLVAGLIVPMGDRGTTMFGLDPLLPLDTSTREGDRIVGPLSAVWYLVFMIPFFLFVPDIKQKRVHDGRPATAELWDTVRALPQNRDMLFFLAARMIYTDGLTAIFTFGGIYGASVFGWGPLELGIFGIILTLIGAFGALIGGVLDDHISAKFVIVTALFLLLLGAIGILSVDKNHVLFFLDVAPKEAGSGPFSSAGEQVFLAFAIVVGLVAAPVQSSSRSLLARLAPPDKITQYFGLFAFSGKVTAFLAPLLVALVTAVTQSQRIGMAAITLFLIVGMALMAKVRMPARRD
ncbi:MFS transporter [Hyphomicrobium sulfonivorans]|uniref:MFS transporter n=1 Tax=Hyphomicrobium sulfonivorans TaxID=121290 RepID=UPI00156EAE9B|nr:MFS transporter [Hyphomicrobium sulfonivorans]MBI1648351.1 MFS transporter [Hyphomicrobium sulfonivorans]NSL71113.1 MFS transporter [Hyphomicrobium sulfonivorans]